MAYSASAASLLSVDTSNYINRNATAVGGAGSITIDPVNAVGWANYGVSSYTPTASGGSVTINLAAASGAPTFNSFANARYIDDWAEPGGPTSDTSGPVISATVGQGFSLSFVPGTVGDFEFRVHMVAFQAKWDYNFLANGTSFSSGTEFVANTTGFDAYDEGLVSFKFNVANLTEAAQTFRLDLTRNSVDIGADAIGITSATLIPESSTALFGSLGLFALRRRRRA